MTTTKTAPACVCSLASRLRDAGLFVVILAAGLGGPLHAQAARTITVEMRDGKTGQPISPDNFIVRFDHRDSIRNETLQLNNDGTGRMTVPPGVSYIALQGSYHNSMDLYLNCDAGMEKDTSTLHWYAVDDILATGVAAPNECFKGKYAGNTAVAPKPGTFTFFVRAISWRDTNQD